MGRTQTRAKRAAEVLQLVERGPDFSLIGYDVPEALKQGLVQEICTQYQRWAASWVTPELQDLLPKVTIPRRQVLKVFPRHKDRTTWAQNRSHLDGVHWYAATCILLTPDTRYTLLAMDGPNGLDSVTGSRFDEVDLLALAGINELSDSQRVKLQRLATLQR